MDRLLSYSSSSPPSFKLSGSAFLPPTIRFRSARLQFSPSPPSRLSISCNHQNPSPLSSSTSTPLFASPNHFPSLPSSPDGSTPQSHSLNHNQLPKVNHSTLTNHSHSFVFLCAMALCYGCSHLVWAFDFVSFHGLSWCFWRSLSLLFDFFFHLFIVKWNLTRELKLFLLMPFTRLVVIKGEQSSSIYKLKFGRHVSYDFIWQLCHCFDLQTCFF